MPRYAGGGKATVESCRSIDVLLWNRLGYLRTSRWFSWAWTSNGERVASINVETQRHSVTLKYRSRSYGEDWSDVEQRVAIAWTTCRFGGERPWFMCSVAANGVYCGRLATKLYGAGRLFACRHCYRLAYASQQESSHQRGLGKSQKIRMQLGGSPNMLEEFPDKPKSPDLTGQMKLQRHTAAAVEQFSHDDIEEVVCNIAGWKNQDHNGPYLTVELSPRLVARMPTDQENIIDSIINDKEEDEH
jgi:hypothetical protein